MTHIAISNLRSAFSTALLPAALLVSAMLNCLSTQAYAEESASPSRSTDLAKSRQTAADLEKAFWACDYAATTRGVSLGEGAICGAIYEDLKGSKFGGDFQVFLTWWQQNKAAEHQALAQGSRTVAAPKADHITSR